MALVAAIGLSTSADAATSVQSPASVECDPDTERPAVWDQESGEVILCESRGEGPAMAPDDVGPDVQLPSIPLPVTESVEPAPLATLPETGLHPAFFGLGAASCGVLAVTGVALIAWGLNQRRTIRRRPNKARRSP